MVAHMMNLERAARLAMGDNQGDDPEPLPPGPNYGPFGYFRLALLLLAGLITGTLLLNLLS
jgi:hypothetical protein